MSKLNARQRAFVRAYTSGKTLGNGRQSARKAGYNGSDESLGVQAVRLLADANVASAIAEREQNADDASIADRYEREQLLTSIMRGEVTEPKVVSDGNGGQMIEQAEPALRDRLKALELHGKMGGDFIDRHEHSGPEGGPIQLQSVPPSIARAQLVARFTATLGAIEAERVVRELLGEPEPVAMIEAPKEAT